MRKEYDQYLDYSETKKEDAVENLFCKVLDKKTEIMIAVIAKNVGTAVMYVYYLAYIAKKMGIKKITFNHICEKIFPMGFFSEESMSEIWDEQKVRTTITERGSDNLLDYEIASKSLAVPPPPQEE